MKKMQLKIRQGSSLIVTILVMGILMTLTLGLSSLVIREIGQTGSLVKSAQAYYAAEAGVENALLELQNSLPGHETKIAGVDVYDWIHGYFSGNESDGSPPSFQYQIRNQGDRYPFFDSGVPVFVKPGFAVPKPVLYKDYPQNTYNVLPLNQTVTIPLFVDCGGGKVRDARDFLLEYYVDFNLDSEVMSSLLNGYAKIKLSAFDILRWKLYGEPMDTPGKTDAISDFYPAREDNNANQPVCIGTDWTIEGQSNTHCMIPVAKMIVEEKSAAVPAYDITGAPSLEPGDIKGKESVSANVIFDSWSMARECYRNESGFAVTGSSDVKKGCTIRSFVDSHTKNYLTLTNVINPGIIGSSNPNLRNSKANIYYRLVARGSTACQSSDKFQVGTVTSSGNTTATPLPREYAEISADGFAAGGSVKQSIDVRMRLNSFLPVFNFSLYRTDVNASKAGD